MLLLLGGTTEAQQVAAALVQRGFPVLVSTATENGAQVYREMGIPVRSGRLPESGFVQLMKEGNVRLVVDASHPYAAELRIHALSAARACCLPFLRFERQPVHPPASPLIHWVDSYEEAAVQAFSKGQRILLTTGSKNLSVFSHALSSHPQAQLFVRLLPTLENMELCRTLGLQQRQIIAMQGPFSYAFNKALLEHLAVDVLVSKESGEEGSLPQKLLPALERQIHVVIIQRPPLPLEERDVFCDVVALTQQVARLWSAGSSVG